MSPVVASPSLEYGLESGAVPVAGPRLSWTTSTDVAGWRQSAAEVELVLGDGRPRTASLEGDSSVLVEWPFADLTPRDTGTLRVRVRDDEGWSEWSAPTSFTATFLADGEWRADFVGAAAPARRGQPVQLRHEFDVADGLVRATFYATAQGAYQAFVNGSEVDDQILKPGWTPYQWRLVHETTDVTASIRPGRNAVGVVLTGAWYTESYGFQGQAAPFYGPQPAFAGQLLLEYADGHSELVVTDDTWRATTEGPWVSAGIYAGEAYDARLLRDGWSGPGFDEAAWEPVVVHEPDPVPGPRTSPVVRVLQQVPVQQVIGSPSGATLLDFGQNLVGRLRIRVRGEAGQVVTLRHAEVLEAGELGIRPLRVAKATDTYTVAGSGEETWVPRFTFHGFRYAEVTGWPGDFDPLDVVAEVVYSDMRRTGWFECSDDMVNRLHENVLWGMRGNFLYLPTDCPQRDERLGWTGDIQIFAPTASFLYDCDGFLASWLVDLALEQKAADGGVPFVVPDVLASGRVPTAAWGDAATVVPTVLHERFGDVGVLARQYPSAKAWTDLVLGLAGERHLWEGSYQWGDWVDPDAPSDDPASGKTDRDLVATAYVFRSATLLADAAGLLGHADDAAHYRAEAEKVRLAWLDAYVTPAGRIVSDAQTAYALAIEFGLATGDLVDRLGDRLGWLVRRDGYRISTGFVGTPLVTDALTRTGHLDQAARMLLQTECPSWLYSVTMGATTIWERWDSMLQDGTINPGEMTSFNHYALGAVADWLHRVVAGLAADAPGYARVRVAPRPIPGLDWARARHDGPYGPIEVGWERADGRIVVTATIPPNSEAVVDLPGTDEQVVGSGTHTFTFDDPTPQVPLGRIGAETALSDIIDDPEAYAAVLAGFASVSDIVADDFRRRTRWVPNQTLGDTFSLVSPKVRGLVLEQLETLNGSRSGGVEHG